MGWFLYDANINNYNSNQSAGCYMVKIPFQVIQLVFTWSEY